MAMPILKGTPYCALNASLLDHDAAMSVYKETDTAKLTSFHVEPVTLCYAGSLLAACSMLGLAFHVHVVQIVCQARMWAANAYLMWFVSQSAADSLNLVIYLYGALVVLFTDTMFTCWSSVTIGKLSNLVYHLRMFHYPFMVMTRFLGVLYPQRYPCIARHTFHAVAILWLSASFLGLVLMRYPVNWLYFHPIEMNWVMLRPETLTLAVDVYWTTLPAICGTTSVFFYLCSIAILRRRSRRSKNTIAMQTRQAGKNLIVLNLSTGIMLLLDTLFWRINIKYLIGRTWWGTCLLSFVEVVQSSSDALLILIICCEIRKKSFVFRHCFTSRGYRSNTTITDAAYKTVLSADETDAIKRSKKTSVSSAV